MLIAFIKGIVAYKDAEGAVIETGGIGYELAMSVHALASLPACGEPAQVWTHLAVKEDDISLFGFSEPAERDLFEKLIAVSGIGPKMAISALSTFKPADLIAHITAGDVTAISTISGVGKKTAQRMILELQGVLKTSDGFDMLTGVEGNRALQDAASALESMGFSAEEVAVALKGCTETETGAIIRYALKHVGGAQ